MSRNYSRIAVATIVGAVTFAMGAVFIDPAINPEKYRKIQAVTRKGMDKEARKKIQPGGMEIWADPWKPLPEPERPKKS